MIQIGREVLPQVREGRTNDTLQQISGNVEKDDVLLSVHFEVILCVEKVSVSTRGSIPWSREKECFLYLLIPLGYQRRLNMLHGKVK